MQNDERVENLLLPVRDGLMIVRKIWGIFIFVIKN
jgi:hypothetical protein